MPPKLGIIAGGGALPRHLVQHCLNSGRAFFVVALKGQADDGAFAAVDHVDVRLGAAGETIKQLRQHGAEDLIFAGAVRKPSLSELRPDLWTARFLARTGAYQLGDDGLLGALIDYLEANEGFRVLGVADVMADLLAPAGVLTSAQPDAGAERDIGIGIAAARDLGRRDIGQAVVTAAGRLVAEEGRSGTDAMLAGLAGEGADGVLVKAVKPNQERRADLPAIGPQTIENAARAGLKGIAVEAGGALILELDETIRAADAAGLFVVGAAPTDEATP
ncbi:MAG: UDP-2,3-diacylglucosamine diphosphatase LpxI [Magnetovibrio sp.]|nr:UDP-2,3-diacylglucosamine diphosphatase LpxI [Magnetovibrio sp.]